MSSTTHPTLLEHGAEPRGEQQLAAWSFARTPSLMLMVGELEQRERFAYALQRALRKRKLSERQLAKALDIDPRKVAAWRSKKRLPDIFEVQALAAELRVSEELFRNPPAIPPLPPEPYYPIDQYLIEAEGQGVIQADGGTDSPRLRKRSA